MRPVHFLAAERETAQLRICRPAVLAQARGLFTCACDADTPKNVTMAKQHENRTFNRSPTVSLPHFFLGESYRQFIAKGMHSRCYRRLGQNRPTAHTDRPHLSKSARLGGIERSNRRNSAAWSATSSPASAVGFAEGSPEAEFPLSAAVAADFGVRRDFLAIVVSMVLTPCRLRGVPNALSPGSHATGAGRGNGPILSSVISNVPFARKIQFNVRVGARCFGV